MCCKYLIVFNDYSCYYSLPNFYYSKHRDLEQINRMINTFYYSIIEEELNAMEVGEILTYDMVDWQAAVYNGVLFLHVYAYTYDWEEHDVFYIDVETMEQLKPYYDAEFEKALERSVLTGKAMGLIREAAVITEV